ncbi:MAG TPA: hypothetical protein VN733_00890 [Solirubrobacterales bacterium]|nr:hypothetical protein [Solirubrobacterales bacterium]
MCSRLTFERFALIAAALYDAPVDEVEEEISRSRAEAALAAPFPGPDEIVLFPNPVEQAALCCAAIIRQRPLPHSNKRVAYECLREMLIWSEDPWPGEEAEDVEAMLDGLGDGIVDEADFVFWARAQVGLDVWRRYQRRRGGYGLGGTWGSPSP